MTTPLSTRFWCSVTLLVRMDIAVGVIITLALLLWLTWH